MGTLTPGTSGVSLGSTGSAFLDLFMEGSLNLGSAQISSGAPEASRDAVTPPLVQVSGALQVNDSLRLARSETEPVVLRNVGPSSARLYSSLTLQGNLSFGVLDDLIPPVTIYNKLGKLDLPAGTTLAGVDGSTGNTGPTGPPGGASTVPGPTEFTGCTGPASSVPGPTGPAGASSGLTGPTGADFTVTGPTGATGASSTVTGPTGPDSTVTGPTGAT